MGNVVILQKDHLKYLDIILDSKVSFLPHIKYVAAKAEKLTTSLMRITPRLGGAGENKRRVLQRCTESILLYDITFWRRRIVGRIGGREVVDTTEGLIALVNSEEGRRLQTSGLRKKEVWCKLPEKFKALFGIDIPGADRTARGKKMNEKYNNLNRMVMRHKKHDLYNFIPIPDITFWRRRIVGRIGGREVVDTTEGLIALVNSEEGRRLQTSGLRKKEVWCKLPEKFKALFGIDIPGADRTARGKKMNEKYNNLNRMVMRHKKHVNRSGAPMKKAPKYFHRGGIK
ncbi:hypothetical protein M8J77_025528 [Diaphorina citri]|nr:hypothetical protein M8J77_025528 [Diaphorina citri]